MRSVLLTLGLSVLAAVWLGLPHRLVPGPFSAHMIMHMGVVALAAPLIAAGVAGTQVDPVRRLPRVFAPLTASLAEFLAVWAWHAPALHHAARHAAAALVLEQATFLLSGLMVWLSGFGGGAHERAERTGLGVVALLLTSMHMTLLGALLALPQRLLYAHGGEAAPLSALHDQQLGGAIMLLAGGLSYLVGGLILIARLLNLGPPEGATALLPPLSRRAEPPRRRSEQGLPP
jgi:putative membrane protein